MLSRRSCDPGDTKKTLDELDGKRIALTNADSRPNDAIGLSGGFTLAKRRAFENRVEATSSLRKAAIAISSRNKLGLESEFRSRCPRAKARAARTAKKS